MEEAKKPPIPPRKSRTELLSRDGTPPPDWTGKSGLNFLVDDVVWEMEWAHKGEIFRVDNDQQFPSEALMKLEVFCYAKGLYGSGEVADAAKREPDLRAFFPGSVPERKTVVRFRRNHRAAIKECLYRIFERAFWVRFGEPNTDPVPVDYCVAMAVDQWFAPICGPQPADEAEARIDQAIFHDGVIAPEED